MCPKLLLAALALLPAAWAATSPAECAEVGKQNVETIKNDIKSLKDVSPEKSLDVEEVADVAKEEQSKHPATISIFADTMSCLDAPSANKFGYPGYDLKNVAQKKCFAKFSAPLLNGFGSNDIEIADITWDPSVCGKRVWTHYVSKTVTGPKGTAEDVHAVSIHDFDDDGKIVGISSFADTLTMKSLGMEKVGGKEEKSLEEKLGKGLEENGAALVLEDTRMVPLAPAPPGAIGSGRRPLPVDVNRFAPSPAQRFWGHPPLAVQARFLLEHPDMGPVLRSLLSTTEAGSRTLPQASAVASPA